MGELSTRTVLKENDLYLLGDAHYAVAAGESELYRRDTRFLCHYEWQLDGQTPQTLMQHERFPFWLHAQGSNAEVGCTLRITRHLPGAASTLTLALRADFVDMFEVRGWPFKADHRDIRTGPPGTA